MKSERQTVAPDAARARETDINIATIPVPVFRRWARVVMYIGRRAGDDLRRRTAGQPPNAP